MELDKDSDEKDFTDSDEDQIFGIDNKDLKTWLVKIPTFVAERWNSVQEPGVELGVLRIYKNQIPDPSNPGSFKSKVTLHVENDAVQMPIPKNYNLTITNLESKNQYVFTESSQGKAVELAGKVQHEAIVGPVVDDDYRRIMHMRTKAAAEANSSRVVKLISDKKSKHGSLIATSGNIWDKQTKKKTVLDKRERMERSDLLDLLFQIFEERPNNSLKALVDRTKQPLAWLREVLNDICIQNKRGPNSGSYELKPEYKQKSQEEAQE